MTTTTTRLASSAEEQDRLLDEAAHNVKRNSFYMKKAIEENQLKDVIRYASDMIYELRTSRLTPQNYYDLYITVTQQLDYLISYLDEIHGQNETSSETQGLYETVQYAGNIIPRLYLLILTGSIYIRRKTSSPSNILNDLLEMCKGVQHPTRGLFLRSYLIQTCKGLLPDTTDVTDVLQQDAATEKALQSFDDAHRQTSDSEYEPTTKRSNDSIEFLLQNFCEVNRLWVRLQHQGSMRDRARRSKERQNLRMLVGTNLVRLSQLECVDLHMYETVVFPRVLEQIVGCKDKLAQEYLMDVLIQVFPDEYHLATLDSFLSTCSQLQPDVQVNDILIGIMNRLANYAIQHPDLIPQGFDMFPLFQDHVQRILQQQKAQAVPLATQLAILVALENFSSKVYPERLECIDAILADVVTFCGNDTVNDPKAVKQIVAALSVPLETLGLRILELEHYSSGLTKLGYNDRKEVAHKIVQAINAAKQAITRPDRFQILLDFLKPLTSKDLPGQPPVAEMDAFDFDREQNDLTKLLHLIRAEKCDDQFTMLSAVRKAIAAGGPERLGYTLPALVTCSLHLVTRLEQSQNVVDITLPKLLNFVNRCISLIASSHPHLAIRLYLTTSCASDMCTKSDVTELTYELMSQAFLTYEEEVADTKAQIRTVKLFASTLALIKSINAENYATLATKLQQYAARMLKKSDQVTLLLTCAQMQYHHQIESSKATEEERQGKKILSCLQRTLKVINNVLDPIEQTQLAVELVQTFVYYYRQEIAVITKETVKSCLEIAYSHVKELDEENATELRVIRKMEGKLKPIQEELE